MIKARLYTMEAWNDAVKNKNRAELEVVDCEREFERILCSKLEKGNKPPFRDAESVRLLAESYNITFADDADWYSVIHNGTRIPLSALSTELKFALTAIRFSRDGKYTLCKGSRKKVWKILADMSFDILIAVRTDDLACTANPKIHFIRSMDEPLEYMLHHVHYPVDSSDFQIENYPYKGHCIDVTVKTDFLKEDDFYTKVPKTRKYTPEGYLYTDKNGKYYVSTFELRYAFQYYWKNDISGIIEYIDSLSLRNEWIRLAEFKQTYNVFEMEELLDNAVLMYTECPFREEELDKAYREGWIDESKHQEILAKHKADGSYQKYMYFKDTFKFIAHLSVFPEVQSRKLPVLKVDKNNDGTYLIHGGLTVKYPFYGEILNNMMSQRHSDRERFAIVVDVNELFSSARDIDKTVFGFLITADCVEIYDRYDAIRLFGEALKEAYNSGRCTISDEFF